MKNFTAILKARSDKIKKISKTLLTAGIITAVLLTGIGCSFAPEGYKRTNSTYPPIVIRDPNEIKQTGLTVEDVLAAYDQFAYEYAYHMNEIIYEGKTDELEKGFSVQFVSLTPGDEVQDNKTNHMVQFPYFHKAKFIDIPPYIFTSPYSSIYAPDYPSYVRMPGFPVAITYNETSHGYQSQDFRPSLCASTEHMQNILDIYSIDKFIMNDERLQTLSGNIYRKALSLLDQECYESFTIDRTLIENANPDQLQALYDLIKNLRKNNLEYDKQAIEDAWAKEENEKEDAE